MPVAQLLRDKRFAARLARRALLWIAAFAGTFVPAIVGNWEAPALSGAWLGFLSGILLVTAGGYLDVILLRKKGLSGPVRQFISALTGTMVFLSFVVVSVAANYAASGRVSKVSDNFAWALAIFLCVAFVGEVWLATQDN